MKIGGQEIVSRTTALAGRSLLSLSVAVILVKGLQVDTTGFTVLGVDLSPTQLTDFTLVVLTILLVALLANAYVDHVAMSGFNLLYSRRRGTDDIFDSGTQISELQATINAVLSALKSGEAERIEEQLKGSARFLADLENERVRMRWVTFAYFYLWTVALPFCSGVAALALLANA